jgi:hypothetical protein
MDSPAIRKAYVDSDAGQLHFRYVKVLGAGELEPLVLLTAEPAGSRVLEPLMRALGVTRSLFALDAPEGATSERCADLFRVALDGLAIDGFHLWADRSAAPIAVALAAMLPARCRSQYFESADPQAFVTDLSLIIGHHSGP